MVALYSYVVMAVAAVGATIAHELAAAGRRLARSRKRRWHARRTA